MTKRGDINNQQKAVLSRLYSFSKVAKYMPRAITPTDLDAGYLIHCRGNRGYGGLLWFEFKELATSINAGQLEALDALLFRGRPFDSLFVCEHARIQEIEVPPDIQRFKIRKWDEEYGGICETEFIYGAEEKYGGWIESWFDFVQERPNSFVTEFRKACGIY